MSMYSKVQGALGAIEDPAAYREALESLDRLEAEIRADERERVLTEVAAFGDGAEDVVAAIRERKP